MFWIDSYFWRCDRPPECRLIDSRRRQESRLVIRARRIGLLLTARRSICNEPLRHVLSVFSSRHGRPILIHGSKHRITVMMPCYNNVEYIEAAATSVLEQKVDVPVELLIVDDGSTDESTEIIRNLGDARIRLIRNQKNRGISAVRNQLLSEARSSLLSSLDGDDVYADPFKLARELAIWLESDDPARTIVYSDIRWIDGNGSEMLLASSVAPPLEGILYQAILDRRVMIPRDFLIPAELARSVGGFDCDLPIYEDWDYKLRLAQRATFRYTHEVGIGYRRHGNGLSGAPPSIHRKCQEKIRQKHAGHGFGGDPMKVLNLSNRLNGILTQNQLRRRKAA